MRKCNILLSTNIMMRKILTKIIHKRNMIINEGESLGATVKLLSRDWKVTGSSSGNNLLCKKQGKVVYNTTIGETPSWTLLMQEL